MYRKLKRAIKKNKLLFSFLHNIMNYRFVKSEKNYENIFSKIIEGNVIVKVKNIPGEYEIDIRSDILKRIVLTNEYEPEIVELILNNLNPNKDVINIGANIGLYSNLTASKIIGPRKVLAIEPTPNAFNLLKKNTHRNNNENKTILFEGVATDKDEDVEMNIILGKEEYSSIGKLVHDSAIKDKFVQIKVKGITLDSLVKRYEVEPGIIIIDVEGSEMKVLKGAKKSLKKYKPIIISELDDNLLNEQNMNSKELILFLKSLNYSVNDIDGTKPTYPFSGNIIAIPINKN